MKISEDNYQEWAMDYLEGTLSESRRAEFETFLAANRDIAAGIASLQEYMPKLTASAETFPDKKSLYKDRGVTPLKRLMSLAGGMAAAAVLIGAVIVAGDAIRRSGQNTAAHMPRLVALENVEISGGMATAEAALAEAVTAPVENAKNSTEALIAYSGTVAQDEEIPAVHEAAASEVAAAVITTETAPDTRAAETSATEVTPAETDGTPAPAHKIRGRAGRLHMIPPTHATVGGGYELIDTAPLTAMAIPDKLTDITAPPMMASTADTRSVLGQRLAMVIRRSIIAPLDEISPVSFFKTDEISGIEIASRTIILSNKN